MAGRQDIEAGSAYVRLYMQQTEFDRGLRTLRRNLTEIGHDFTYVGGIAAAAGTTIVGAIVMAAKSFSSFGDTINDMSARTGIAADTLSELKYAAEQAGASLDTVETGIRKMQQVIGSASTGSQGAIDVLRNLALSAEMLAGMSPDDQFLTIAARIAAIEDPTLRAAAAIQVFGRSGTELLPMITSDMQAMREEARKLGLVMSGDTASAAAVLDDALNQMKLAGEAAWNKIGEAAAPVLTDLVKRITDIAVQAGQWIDANKEVVVTVLKVGAVVGGIGYSLLQLGTILKTVSIAVGGLSTAMTFMAAHPVAIVAAGFIAAATAISYFESTAQRLPSTMGQVRAKSDEMRAADKALFEELQSLSEKQRLTNEEMDRANAILDTLQGRYGKLGVSVNQATGAIDGMSGAQAKLNEAMKRATIAQLKAEAQGLQVEINRMEEARAPAPADTAAGEAWQSVRGTLGAVTSGELWLSDEDRMRRDQAALDAINAERAKRQALLDRIAALEGGDTGALTGDATVPAAPIDQEHMIFNDAAKIAEMNRRMAADLARSRIEAIEDEQQRAIAAINARYDAEREKAKELGAPMANVEAARDQALANSNARFAREKQEEERRSAETKADANQRLADDTKRLEIEQSTTDEKERQRRLLEFERGIALRDAQASGAAGADVSNINAYYDARLAGIRDAVREQAASGPIGTFSTAAAAAMTGRFGGTEQQRTAKATEDIAKNTRAVPEMFAKFLGVPDAMIAEFKKIFAFS